MRCVRLVCSFYSHAFLHALLLTGVLFSATQRRSSTIGEGADISSRNVKRILKRLGWFKQNMVNAMTAESPNDRLRSNGEQFLIVGLGNSGRKYRNNRHNVGFTTIDRLAETHDIQVSRVQQRALVGNGRIAHQKVILTKPQTMMNLSGDAVGPLAKYYRIPPANVLVIYDELDLPLGTIRLREKGGAGGHNGMKSIIQHLGNDFPRLRLGIGRPPGRMPPAAYVLQNFDQVDLPLLDQVIDEALKAIEIYLTEGIDLAMSRHNKSVKNGNLIT